MSEFIKNRKDQNIAVVVKKAEEQKGLVFVMHGLGGFKEQDHVRTFAEAFSNRGLTVVLFDTTNTFGESDGKYEDSSYKGFYEDLEDVIAWASVQVWYREPFWLVGHSLGGFSVALYAEKYPEKVKGLAPISAVVSGKLAKEAYKKYSPDMLKKWEETGWRISESKSKPGIMKKLKWSFFEDSLKYDLLEDVSKLIMPVLLIVGEEDKGTPPEHNRILYDALPGEKQFHIIKGAEHTFRESKHFEEIKKLLEDWIDKYL